MSEKIETQAKTVNEAVSEALLQLGLRRDEVDIKVLEEPKSGLLGFIGSRPARVLVSKKRSRSRGRGRGQRDDEMSHDLSGDRGSSRGGRGRGGRGGRRNDERRGDGNEARGDGRRGRGDEQEKREGSRRGRGRRSDNSRNEERNDKRNDNRNEARDERKTSERADEGRRNDDNRNQGNGDGAPRSGRRRSRGGRGRGGRGRSRRENQPETGAANNEAVEAAPTREREESRTERPERTERTERSERPGREGGRSRSRRSRRNDSQPAVEAETVVNAEPVETTPAPEAVEAPAPERPSEAPAAALAETPEPAEPAAPEAPAKPKARAWGGLGSRLKRTKPSEPIKTFDEPSPASIGAVVKPPRKKPQRGIKRAHVDLTGGEQSSPGAAAARMPEDDLIAGGIEAKRYATPIEGGGETEALNELATGMLARAGFPCECATEADDYHRVRIATDEDSAGMLIGRHGQTIDAVEHLVERMASNAVGDRVRMNLDINEYRGRREEALRERALDAVTEVRETGDAYHFESMSARERRIVHMATADAEGLTTYTVMDSGGKHVVLDLDDGEEAQGD